MMKSINDGQFEVAYGQKRIVFRLIYSDRTTMEIAVLPDSSVTVKAPQNSDLHAVARRVRKRARWIVKQQNYFKQFRPRTPERCYVGGETHLYLGRQYRLKLSKGTKNSVTLSRGYFHITCRNEPTPDIAKKLLNTWYADKAKHHFAESMTRCWRKFADNDSEPPKLVIRRMQKRWGSLSQKGTITLNSHLIKAPKECIDYVVLHELCHLKYHNHSARFYQLLDTISPGWEKIKHKLELSMA